MAWPLEPAPEPQLARNGRSSLPLNRRMLEKCCSSLARSRKMLEKCCSSLPRSRRMLEKCRSSLPRSDSMRSKSTVFYSSVIGISFCSAPLCSVGLGLAGAFELAARTLSASLRPRPGRAERKRTDPDKPSLPRDASQGGAADACCTPSPLGLAGALDLAARARSASLGRSTGQSLTKANRTRQASGQAYSETLRWAGPRMLVALNTETSILRALNARVRTSIYIYIYKY
jgi:hypothetical protein